MSYYITEEAGLVSGLYHSSNKNVPPEATPIEDSVGAELSRCSDFSKARFVGGSILLLRDVEESSPIVVTKRQARLALLAVGLLDSLEEAIKKQPRAVQVEWESASVIDRRSPLIAYMAAVLGWTDEQVDKLFAAASAIQ